MNAQRGTFPQPNSTRSLWDPCLLSTNFYYEREVVIFVLQLPFPQLTDRQSMQKGYCSKDIAVCLCSNVFPAKYFRECLRCRLLSEVPLSTPTVHFVPRNFAYSRHSD